jgi:hypothetical protein
MMEVDQPQGRGPMAAAATRRPVERAKAD